MCTAPSTPTLTNNTDVHPAFNAGASTSGIDVRLAEAAHITLALLLAAALISAVTVVAGSVSGAVEAVRNLALHAGLALVSGRIFGRALSWILPIIDFIVLDFWGSDGAHPHWWAWQFQGHDSGASWIAGGVALAAGFAALVLPPRVLTSTITTLLRPFR